MRLDGDDRGWAGLLHVDPIRVLVEQLARREKLPERWKAYGKNEKNHGILTTLFICCQ